MTMNVPLGGAPTRWVNGVEVKEQDQASTGASPEPVKPSLTAAWSVMPVHDGYAGVIDNTSVGVRERVRDGRHEAQAFAACYDGSMLESPVYGLILDADERSVTPPSQKPEPMRVYDMTTAAAVERATRAARARALMKDDERSPLDMIGIARELGQEARSRAQAYEQEQAKQAAQAKQDQEDIALAQRVRRGMELLDKEQKKGKKS